LDKKEKKERHRKRTNEMLKGEGKLQLPPNRRKIGNRGSSKIPYKGDKGVERTPEVDKGKSEYLNYEA